MIESAYLRDILRDLRGQKELADRALAQVDDAGYFRALDPESNSLAVLVKHLGGNLRSRWSHFLTSDGEKPDRRRDSEFVIGPEETRARLTEGWEEGWRRFLGSIESLRPSDLERNVLIRGESIVVIGAIHRAFGHAAQHVGQIIFLAKHLAKGSWKTLSVPRGGSEEFNARTRERAASARSAPASATPASAAGAGPLAASRIGQIALSVSDLPQATAFYRDTLGLRLLLQLPGMAFLDCGGIRILLATPEKPGQAAPPSSTVLYLRTDSIGEAYRAITARGAKGKAPPHKTASLPDHDLWMAFFRDPDGHFLALMSELPRGERPK